MEFSIEKTQSKDKTEHLLGKPHNVILFNDDNHEMQEVTFQIIRAISCTYQRAYSIMLQAHFHGRSVVITAHKERCEHVSGVLEQIRLGTKIEPAG